MLLHKVLYPLYLDLGKTAANEQASKSLPPQVAGMPSQTHSQPIPSPSAEDIQQKVQDGTINQNATDIANTV